MGQRRSKLQRSSSERRAGGRTQASDGQADTPGVPDPSRWVTEWPWRKWSRWQRVAVVSQIGVRALVGAAAVVSAVVLLLGLGPQAYSSFFWREIEYRRLAALHAGFNLDAIRQELGQPSIRKSVYGTPYTESIFLRKEHMVMTISDSVDSVLLYSVLS